GDARGDRRRLAARPSTIRTARSRTMAPRGLPMLPFLRDLLAHAEWANAVFFHAWAKSPARDHEELRARVAHILGVQHGFLSILRGEPPGTPRGGPPPSFEDLKARAVTGHAGLGDFAAALRPEALSEAVRIPWFPDPPCVVTVAEALVQVAL